MNLRKKSIFLIILPNIIDHETLYFYVAFMQQFDLIKQKTFSFSFKSFISSYILYDPNPDLCFSHRVWLCV